MRLAEEWFGRLKKEKEKESTGWASLHQACVWTLHNLIANEVRCSLSLSLPLCLCLPDVSAAVFPQQFATSQGLSSKLSNSATSWSLSVLQLQAASTSGKSISVVSHRPLSPTCLGFIMQQHFPLDEILFLMGMEMPWIERADSHIYCLSVAYLLNIGGPLPGIIYWFCTQEGSLIQCDCLGSHLTFYPVAELGIYSGHTG